jgi:hypothetical protein
MVRNIVQGKACQEGHMDQGRVMFKLESSRPPKKCPWSPTHRNPAMMRRPWLCPLWDHTQGHDYDATFPHWQPYSETRRNVHLSASPSVFIDFERTKLTKSGDKAISREAKASWTSSNTTGSLPGWQSRHSNENKHNATIFLQTMQTEMCREKFRHFWNIFKPTIVMGISSIVILTRTDDQDDDCDNFHVMAIWYEQEHSMQRHLIAYNVFRANAHSLCRHGMINDAIIFLQVSQ